MEYLDLYDKNARKTGRVILRGMPIHQGEYSMAVHLYIYDTSGRFLMQKRSKTKRSLPGIWSITCGAVSSGEDSVSAGIREAKEEVGLTITAEDMEMICRIRKKRSFVDVYFVKKDFNIEDCVLQREEVDAVRLCTGKEMFALISSYETRHTRYIDALEEAMRERGFL